MGCRGEWWSAHTRAWQRPWQLLPHYAHSDSFRRTAIDSLRNLRYLRSLEWRLLRSQALQKRHQLSAFYLGDHSRFQLFVEVRVLDATFQHEIDRFIQRLCTAVVEKRTGFRDAAQGWRLEST